MTVKLNVADLEFILRQVKISEAHSNGTALTDIYVDADGNVVAQGTAGAIQAISSPLLPSGLRTVDGTYNNLIPGRETWGAADTPMPRLLDPNFLNDADGDVMPLGPPGGPLVTNTDYGVIGAPSATNGGHTGNVADADPRIISNLVVDQSVNNPAAVAAWFANDAALSAFHERYGVDAIPVRPGEGSVALAVANASFENQSLADGQPGVTSSPLGNYSLTAPTGWTISGGVGGLFAPAATVTDAAGHPGPNVAWLTGGATLSQNSGPLTAGTSYKLSLSVGDRTDQVWSGGAVRMIAVGAGGVETVISTMALPDPTDGQWADLMLDSGPIAAGLAGQTLRIEVQQTGASQVLVDNVSLTSGEANKIEIDNVDLATIPNIAPDDGISAPFNAWMTFFGQFFDHGLDLITKGDNGTVYIPLQPDDPLVLGADGLAGTADDLPQQLRFMAVTRSTAVDGPGADGILGTADDTQHEGQNTTTPYVDQNQTYTSHSSHQVFVREYVFDANGNPVSTGKLMDGANGGLPTWAEVKAQARDMLGIELTDGDVLNIPLLRTDQYGEFLPGPNGLPQIVIGLGADGIPNTADDNVVEGDLAAPVNTFSAGAVRIGHAFLDDIAHAAGPFDGQTGTMKIADDDTALGLSDSVSTTGTYDNEMLDRHFITGDGRGNENIGLTSVHHVFHSEHNRQVEAQKAVILESGDIDFINEWLLNDIAAGDPIPTDPATLIWDGERIFQAARFATEMQYQHLVFEEFGRKLHPNIDPFVFNAVTDINPSIFAEFASVVYRFGHSMLTENMPRVMVDEVTGNVSTDNMGLVSAFLNPIVFDNDGAMSADAAAAAVILGMTSERGSQIDEFIVPALRSNLLGLPLDLAAINIARGRDTGMPSFNDARAELYQQTNSVWLKPYENWVELASNLKTPMTVVNLIAAYGTHATILAATTLEEKRDAAFDLVFGGGAVSDADRFDYLLGRNGWTSDSNGLNSIDLWVGGLSERIMPFGGMLGSTFTAVFEAQMEALQDGDRFYYLTRTQGQNFLNELEQNSFSKMLLANTSLSDPGPDGIRGTSDDIVRHHIGVDSFAQYDYVLEINQANQFGNDPVGNDPVLEGLGMGKVVRDDPTTSQVETNYLRFTGGEHVVVGGTSGNDTIITSDGDDGIWGDDGDDYIESGFGVDLVNGGGGNDIILDAGDEGDFLKGEDGDDVMATASGADILMGGDGKDVIFLGADASEVFGGEGDDFILGGDGADFLMGNEGNDWIESGPGFDTSAGDNSQLFFNSEIKGHDVMFAGTDEHDFDAESGDDIMIQGASVMRNEGMFGFDWAAFKGMALDAYADMRIKIFTTDEQDILRNRFDKVEALSGWDHNDTLIGDDRVAPGTGEADENALTNDGLDQEGIDRIDGLSDLVSIVNGEEFWESGNIIIGGGGSDVITGNGGDDIIDGDRWLNVRIRITDQPYAENSAANEIASVDTLRHIFTTADGVDPNWVGKSLFELLVSRTIVPGQMNIVREILDGGQSNDIDVAVFNDDQDQYTITDLGNGVYQVAHTGFGTNAEVVIDDGIDTLHNIEVLRFRDGDVALGQQPATGAPVISDLTPTEGQPLTVDLSGIADANGIAGPISVQWQSFDGTNWVNIPGATGASFTPNDPFFDLNGPQVGRELRVVASFTDGAGVIETVISAPTAPVGDVWSGGIGNQTFNGTEGDDVAIGNNRIAFGPFELASGDNVLNGNGGNDVLEGRGGNDTVNGGTGDDLVLVNFTNSAGGRDIIDGGDGVDTVQITGTEAAETFRIYTRDAALLAGLTGLAAMTEIVITRNGAIIAELDNVEEIIVNGADATPPADGTLGGDTIQVFGDFSTTSLNLNTITINGTTGDDVVDISSLSSAHRIVFRGEGGNDTIVGTLRPQDLIDLPGTGDPTTTTGENGMVTVSRGGASVTFDGSAGMPGLDEGDLEDQNGADEGSQDDAEAEGETSGADDAGTDGDVGTTPPAASSGQVLGTAAGEALFGTDSADNILALGGRDMIFAGDGDDNVLAGSGGDMLFGDGGNDRLFGQGGDDFIDGGIGNDFVVGGDGDDTFVATSGDGDDVYYGDDVSGGTGTDTLDMSRVIEDITVDLGSGPDGRGQASSAETGTDVLWSIENFIGGAGDDVITAGQARNMLDGGAGNDVYRFLSAQDADGDTIGSFQPGDKIDLSQIDANGSGAGNGNFSLVSDAFTGSGQLLVTHETGEDGEMTIIQGSVDGDASPDFSISIRGRHELTQDDFQY
ncbi:peroxidase family protein [Roseovarius arcticus]|uniref:peroxidase family protein n=1 Tax=Roseovarius arcticus TaxID=2547404 RepID=UPI0011109433|nr:peroxidase family protein [Roseovarius arcticus]